MSAARPAPVAAYLATVFALSWALQGWIALRGGIEGAAFDRLAPLVMFVPGLVAVGFTLRRRGAIRWRLASPVALLLGVLLPAVAAVLCSLAIQAAGWASSQALRWQDGRLLVDHRIFLLGPGDRSPLLFLLELLASAPVFAALGGLLAMGEELGWRGWLQEPLVARLGPGRGLTLLGLVWGWWHAPLVLLGYNYPETPVLGALVLLPLVGVGLSFFLGGLTLPSRSVWPAVLAHGSVNAFFGVLVYGLDFTAPRLPADGVVLAATSLLGALGWWRLPRRAPQPRRGSLAAAPLLLLVPVLLPATACRLPPSAPPGGGPQRELAVTLDDLPFVPPDLPVAEQRRHTERLLRGLGGAPVVGFVNEDKLEVDGRVDPARVALLELWLAAGAELGNHTFGHVSLHSVPAGAYERDVLRGERVLRPLLERAGRPLRWFRHPFLRTGRDLATRDRVHAFLAEHGYRVAPVTIDNADWIFARAHRAARDRGAEGAAEADLLVDELVTHMELKTDYWERQSVALFGREIRQVLLLHANEINAEAMPRLMAMWRARGYRFVTLERALADPAYGSPDAFTGEAGIGWIHRWLLTAGGRPLPDEPRTPEWVLRAAGVESE